MIGTLAVVAFVLLGGAAVAVAWPAYRSRQARREQAGNVERYLAWRGRATTGAGRSALDDVAEARERSRIRLAGILGAAALVCLVIFFIAG